MCGSCTRWAEIRKGLAALQPGEEYPVALCDGDLSVIRGRDGWDVSIVLASPNSAEPFRASERYDSLAATLGAVGELIFS